MRMSRRKWGVLVGLGALVVGAWASVSPIVRAKLRVEAARHHLEVDVENVDVGWFAVRLRNVHVRAEGIDAIEAEFPELRVELSGSLSPSEVELKGGAVSLRGSVESLASSVRAWRASWAHDDGAQRAERSGSQLRVSGHDIALHWVGASAPLRGAEAGRVSFSRAGGSLTVDVAELAVTLVNGAVSGEGARVELDRDGALRSARADCVDVTLDLLGREATAVATGQPEVAAVAAAVLAEPARKHAGLSRPAPLPYPPIFDLPDPHRLRARVESVAKAIGARLPDGVEVEVGALSFAVKKDGKAFSGGPGTASAVRHGSRVSLHFASVATAASSPLSLRAELPMDGEEASVSFDGGPVSLALLGIKEGMGGLADVDRGAISAKGRVTVPAAGTAVVFDGQLHASGVGIHQPKIAREVIHGLDVSLAGRGMFDDQGLLKVDDLSASIGALRMNASGSVVQRDAHVELSVRADVPTASCQSILDSIPAAIIPTIAGTKLQGTFGGHVQLSFDSRNFDDLVLEQQIAEACQFVEVPSELAHTRFTRPFQHHVYLPDGTTVDETTGPGSTRWVPLGSISPYMQVAVLTTEDGGFFRHHGFSAGAIRSALIANLKARRFVRGASTITHAAREEPLSHAREDALAQARGDDSDRSTSSRRSPRTSSWSSTSTSSSSAPRSTGSGRAPAFTSEGPRRSSTSASPSSSPPCSLPH